MQFLKTYLNFGCRIRQKKLQFDVLELNLWMSGAVIDEQQNLALVNSELAVPTLQPLLKNIT
jgi:hypothetical protein